MTSFLLTVSLPVFHVAMMALCRHFVRRRHYPFFQAHRRKRGKRATYGHFLLLYASWLDPAMLAAAASRPGHFADQTRCACLYTAGLIPVVFTAVLILW